MRKKILLADDSITIQKVVELTFPRDEFEVATVGNGRLAVDKAASFVPDLVLCDVIMPQMDGYQAAAGIRAIPGLENVPILLLNGAFEPYDAAKAQTVGALGNVSKPFEPPALVARVREILDSLKAQAAAVAEAAAAQAAAFETVEPEPASPAPYDDPLGAGPALAAAGEVAGMDVEAPYGGATEPAPTDFDHSATLVEEAPLPMPIAGVAPEGAGDLDEAEVSEIEESAPEPIEATFDSPAEGAPPSLAAAAAIATGYATIDEFGDARPAAEAAPHDAVANPVHASAQTVGEAISDFGDDAEALAATTVEVPEDSRAMAATQAFDAPVFGRPGQITLPEPEIGSVAPGPDLDDAEIDPRPLDSALDSTHAGGADIASLGATEVPPAVQADDVESMEFDLPAPAADPAPEPIETPAEPQAEPRSSSAPEPTTGFPDVAVPEVDEDGTSGGTAPISLDELRALQAPNGPPAAAPVAASALAAPAGSADVSVPVEMVQQIAQRVIAQVSERIIREIAWDVIPELAQRLVQAEIERIRAESKKS